MSKNTSEQTRKLYFDSPSKGSEKKINLTSTIIACAFSLAIGCFFGYNFDYLQNLGNRLLGKTTVEEVDFSSLNEVYSTLARNYDGEVSLDKVLEEAKRGIASSVGDEYTYYITASEYAEFNNNLNGDVGAGIGIEIGKRNDYPTVLRTTENNPARRAGILAGDVIYKVNDEEVYSMSAEDVANRIRGAAGTEVTVTIVRGGSEELSFTMTRETINNESVYLNYIDNAAVMTISRFDKDTGTLVENYAKEILEKNVEKVIVDLRSNGGGYVDTAVEAISIWLDGVKVTDSKSSKNSYYNKTYNAKTGKAILGNMKTVVLVNGSTASAAEIFAAALRDHGKATLVGETTFGKGVMQSLETLSDGGVLRVTIAGWYTPNGLNIGKSGITPDESVERSYDQINRNEDPQLERALEL